jgi:hypothetical protein
MYLLYTNVSQPVGRVLFVRLDVLVLENRVLKINN